ncbi:MAG: hypothetical protein M5R36_27040 [Deltaproteobacteria bacterium]|nr:hypothetical protein [Deltaproteobacteria bacterium]
MGECDDDTLIVGLESGIAFQVGSRENHELDALVSIPAIGQGRSIVEGGEACLFLFGFADSGDGIGDSEWGGSDDDDQGLTGAERGGDRLVAGRLAGFEEPFFEEFTGAFQAHGEWGAEPAEAGVEEQGVRGRGGRVAETREGRRRRPGRSG